MPSAKAGNVRGILNNTDLEAKDFQEESVEDWLKEKLEGLFSER